METGFDQSIKLLEFNPDKTDLEKLSELDLAILEGNPASALHSLGALPATTLRVAEAYKKISAYPINEDDLPSLEAVGEHLRSLNLHIIKLFEKFERA